MDILKAIEEQIATLSAQVDSLKIARNALLPKPPAAVEAPLEKRKHVRFSKLDPAKVRQVRSLSAAGISDKELASKFGVCVDTVYSIRKGHTWAWVK